MQKNSCNGYKKNCHFEENAPICLINLSAIKDNANLVKEKTNAKFCAVVKSDAYGHGIVECANELFNACDYFAVGTVEEGIKLRIAGINTPILCLIPVKDIYRACRYGIDIVVHTYSYAKSVRSFCNKFGITACVHVAVNSGMNRLGIDNLCDLKKIISLSCDNFQIKGVFSHLFSGENIITSEKQLIKFIPYVNELKSFNSKVLAHISATSGFSLDAKFHLDMARIGLAMYGYNAINDTFPLKKAMKVVAPLVQARNLKTGENLLYGDYKVKSDINIGIYGYGYSNGSRNGVKNIKNNACMNICAIKGNKKCVEIMNDASIIAKSEKTIVYDILTRFGLSCKRVYYYGDKDESCFW